MRGKDWATERAGWGAGPAIIVLDMTNAFTDPDSPVGADLTEVIAETNRVLAVVRTSGVPVVLTSIAYEDPISKAAIG